MFTIEVSKSKKKRMLTKIFSYIVLFFAFLLVGFVSQEKNVGAYAYSASIGSSSIVMDGLGDCCMDSVTSNLRVGSQSINILQGYEISKVKKVTIYRDSRSVQVDYKWSCGFLWLDTCTDSKNVGTVNSGTDARAIWFFVLSTLCPG